MFGDPTVSILIVSYNTREMTLSCIRSLTQETKNESYELIVVDNQSQDGSHDAILTEFPNINIVCPTRNLGFGRANKLAAEAASGEYLLLLNPDTVILDRAIERLIQFAKQNPAAGIWGGRTVFEDGSLNPTSCWRYMTPWSVFCQAVGLKALFPRTDLLNPEGYGGWKRDDIRPVEIVSGCFFLIERRLWDDLEGFDPDFFMYAEEADLCFRARARGAQPMFAPAATIIHHGGASEPARADKLVKLFAGKMTFIRRHWSPATCRLAVVLFHVHTLVRVAGFSVAALISRAPKRKTSAREWREVWRRRLEWSDGWPGSSRDL